MKLVTILLLIAAPVAADPMLIDDFSNDAADRWRYTSDRVMGGVSDGRAALASEGEISFAQLRGTVSTANNGGFIQIRHDLTTPLPSDSTGIRLRARGNGATYYIHVRPTSSRRPWQFFQASFPTTPDWAEITLQWSDFSAQGGLRGVLAPADIQSIGIVAYGADYEASLDVDWIASWPGK